MKPQFPIGFWNYGGINNQGPRDVRDWADLGMSLCMTPSFHADDDPQKMLSLLDACEAHNIRVIVRNAGTLWADASVTPAAYEERFRTAYDRFGHHPAVFGFHVGDEPLDDKAFADATAAYQIQKRVAPELTPFLNFNPYWHGIEDLLHCTDFPTWLSDFAKNAGIPLLSYDMYGQMAPQPSGVEDYFNNLRLFSAAAEKAGADLWTTMLSVGHYHYRVPNEDDFRWQLNTAVASGVKGVMWFVVYAVNISNYRMAPFDEFGEKTATFEYLSRVNRHFLHQFGDFFLSAKRLSTTHYKQAFGGYPLFEAGKTDAQLTEITTEYGDLPAIVSFFEKDGKRYVALVNNSQKESALFHPHFSKTAGVREVTKLTWDGTFRDLRYNPSDVDFKETETEFILDSWLAPGQLDLYCIEQA